MANDSDFLIQLLLLLAFVCLMLCIVVSLSKIFGNGELEWAGVPVTVLSAANIIVSVKYGSPFKRGHTLEGLLFLLCVVVAAISLLYSVGTYFWSSIPWGKLGELLGYWCRQSEDTVGLLDERIELAETGPGSGTLMDGNILYWC